MVLIRLRGSVTVQGVVLKDSATYLYMLETGYNVVEYAYDIIEDFSS